MSPRPIDPHEPHQEEAQRDTELGAALSGLPVPDHGPTFWAELTDRLSDETAVSQPIRAQGETTVPNPTGSATDVGPAADPTDIHPETTPVSLDERRERRAARRGGRMSRSLGAAAAAVALVVAAAGAVSVIRSGDNGTDRDVRAADRPGTTAKPGPSTPAAPAAPAEFSATYSGVEGIQGSDECPPKSPGAVCRNWRLTVARDGSYRWTSTEGSDDLAFDATTGRHVEIVSDGPGASKARPNAFVSTGVPAGGPDQGVYKPEPLGEIADFVVALARAADSRVTTTTVAGRPAWHYDGPAVQDRLGGDGAPNHAVADVDQASGVLLNLTRSVGDNVITRFTASDIATSDQIDRARYRLDPPAGAKTTPVAIGFVRKTLDEAAAAVPYALLVPGQLPDGFTLDSVNGVAVNRDHGVPTGPEGVNAPSVPVVSMTWRNGASQFTVTLRPSEGHPDWTDPDGSEGMVLGSQPVRLPLAGRPALVGEVAVDAPVVPHLWGVTGDIVVTVSGDLPRADLERVASSLQAHRAG